MQTTKHNTYLGICTRNLATYLLLLTLLLGRRTGSQGYSRSPDDRGAQEAHEPL